MWGIGGRLFGSVCGKKGHRVCPIRSGRRRIVVLLVRISDFGCLFASAATTSTLLNLFGEVCEGCQQSGRDGTCCDNESCRL
jgi:hypothetical protein